MKPRWLLAPAQPERAQAMAVALGVSPLTAQCLLNRGQDDLARAAVFLAPRLRHLADPVSCPRCRLRWIGCGRPASVASGW